MEFEWDVLKAATNVDKHGVSFQEAETVFGDPFELTIPDPGHSGSEARWVSIGYSSGGRLIVVVHTQTRRPVPAYQRQKSISQRDFRL